MSTIGKGYGSEYHLRSLLAEDDPRLSAMVLNALLKNDGTLRKKICWHSNYLTVNTPEVRGMDFLPEPEVKTWKLYWPDHKANRDPNRRGIHNWDAVGTVCGEQVVEYLLVEAKAHVEEFENSPGCGARGISLQKITRAFQKTRLAMGIATSLSSTVPPSWFLKGGYQIANRLASLNFLLNETNSATSGHLLFVYFLNDSFDAKDCPSTESVWGSVLKKKYMELGIPEHNQFSSRIHYLFFDCRK